MAIKLHLEGFDELLAKIEQAGGTIDGAVETCMRKSAGIMEAEIKAEMSKSGVDSGLVSAMPPYSIEREGNRISARVGYKKGTYDPENLSDGYKVVFLNYGTPRRSKHGKIAPLGFIQRAKKSAAKKIKKQQEETLTDILEDLEG